MIGENQRKKNGEDKFDYREKTVEINKVLISALKPLGFLGAKTTMTITLLMNLIMNQGIEIIILQTSSFFTEPISFPVFSTVRCYITLLQ